MAPGRQLTLLPEVYVVVKCPVSECPIGNSSLLKTCSFLSITQTPEEISIICPEQSLQNLNISQLSDLEVDRPWCCIKVEGPLDFGLVGILHSILEPLKYAGVSVLAVGTFNTDYFLVKLEKMEKTIQVLKNAGFTVNQ